MFPLIAGCKSVNPLKIGAPVPRTGPYVANAVAFDRAITLAVDELNAEGGVYCSEVDKAVIFFWAWSHPGGKSGVLIAIGMALVYGITKTFNFAYDSFFMLSGYTARLLFSFGPPDKHA